MEARGGPITASGGVPVATAVAPRRPRRPARPTRLSAEDRAKAGRSARALVSRSSHGAWAPSATRQDPIAILSEQDATRVAQLVPIRYGRMLESALAFYRGAAAIMAADLADAPRSGLDVQL